MFWLIEQDRENNLGYTNLIHSLKRLYIPHEIIPPVSRTREPDLSKYGTHDMIMVYGGKRFVSITQKYGWKPGSFANENFYYPKWREVWGENLLNHAAVIGKLKEIRIPWFEFFVRPITDNKDFTGMVLNKHQWHDRTYGLVVEGVCYCKGNPEVMVSQAKTVFNEYRFFVVNGNVVSWSQYYKDGNLFFDTNIDTQILTYAQKMVDIWQPAVGFTIDIGSTPEGLKIIEINNLNSSAIYAANTDDLVLAIEDLGKYKVRLDSGGVLTPSES